MTERGNASLLFYLLLLIYSTKATVKEDASTSTTTPRFEVTSPLLETTPPALENATSTTNTSPLFPRTSRITMMDSGNISDENSTVFSTTTQSVLKESVGVTESSTPGNMTYTHIAGTLVSSATSSSQNNSYSATSEPTTATPHTSDVLGKLSTAHVATTANSNATLTSADIMTSASINSTEHTSYVADKAGTMQMSSVAGNVSGLPEPTTHEKHSVTNSTSSSTRFKVTTSERPIVSSTLEIVTTHTESLTKHSSRTEYSVSSTSGTFPTATVLRSTMNDLQNGSSIPVTMSSLTVESGTSSKNKTTWEPLSPSLVPSTDDHTEGSRNITTIPGVDHTEGSRNITTTPVVDHTEGSRNITTIPVVDHTERSRNITTTPGVDHTEGSRNITTIPGVDHTEGSLNITIPGVDHTEGSRNITTTPVVDHTEGSRNITTISGVDHTSNYRNITTIPDGQMSTATDSNPCRNRKCPPFSTCVPKFSSYTCTCPPGFYFETPDNCITGRIFPGILHLNSLNYTSEMDDHNSLGFDRTAKEIQGILDTILKNEKGYVRSAVTKLSRGSVIAEVENIFQQFANVTSEEIANTVRLFIKSCTNCGPLKKGDVFNEQDICSLNTCDNTTAICQSSNGVFTCDCKHGYFKRFPTDLSCAACASGFKLENKMCVKCPFGYAGFNCDDGSLLAVVVISCVLGGLLVILVTSLLITCYRSKEAQKELYEHETYLMWPKQQVPKIPRVTMNRDSAQIDYGSKNILMENELSNGNTLDPQISRVEDMKTFTNANPSRYSFLRQGQTNPYFVNEET